MLRPEPKRIWPSYGLAGRTGYRPGERALVTHLFQLRHAFLLHFGLLFTYVLLLNREGPLVPSNNEFLYLLQLAKQWNPNLLSNDWTFSGPLTSHFVFNLVFGSLTLLFPLDVVGWIGRILSWSLIIVALFAFGQHFRIPLWTVTVAILLWLFYGQSIVGGEWILGTFEAKCTAYALLFFSLTGFMHQRVIWPSILLGFAFSFHPLVGFWSILAIGSSLLVLGHRLTLITKFACFTGLFALPGLIPLLVTFVGSQGSDDWQFISLVVIPYHFDPFYFARNKVLIFQLFILLSFNLAHFFLANKSYALRFLLCLQVFLALFFGLGFLARLTDNYEVLKFMPLRLLPVLVPFFFFLQLISALHHFHAHKYRTALLLLGVFAFASFGNPIETFIRNVRYHHTMWTQEEDDVQKAFTWIATNTPDDAVVISPPWRGDSFYYSRRAQIASWWVPRFDRLTEWRERLELLGGNLADVEPPTTKARMDHMARHYGHLTERDIQSLAQKYGAKYLISSAEYSYPVLYHSGNYEVYLVQSQGSTEVESYQVPLGDSP